jgi:pimeloyl-ACP methyl ester carboxylesterase
MPETVVAIEISDGGYVTDFVLVHGAWHDTWCWERVVPELRLRGHEAAAVALPKEPGAGTQEYAAAIDAAISSPADTVLVAHSASGLVAPIVAGRRRVSELVLVAALMQVPGYSWADQLELQRSAQHTELFRALMRRILVDERGTWTWRMADAAKLFYNDCEPADAIGAAQRLRLQAVTIFTETSPPAPPAVPTRYVVCSQDRAVSRGWAIRTAREQFDAIIVVFDASHSPFWSRPADLAGLLTNGRSAR